MPPLALRVLAATALFALVASSPLSLDTSEKQAIPVLYEAVVRAEQSGSDFGAFPSDVQQMWILEESMGEYVCPKNITHTTWSRLRSGSIGIDHNTIIQDGVRCDSSGSERRLEFFESEKFDEELNALQEGVPPIPQFFKDMLTSTGPNIIALYKLKESGEKFLFGYESVMRVCGGDTKWQPGSTAFIARPMAKEYEITGLATRLSPGFKYMLMVPRFETASCLYSVEIPVEPSAEPEPESSPGVELGPVTVGFGDESATEDEDKTALQASPDEEESEPACFPASATVNLDSGAKILISNLSVGDRVLVGENKFSLVHAFTHRDNTAKTFFIQLTLSSGAQLRASAGHFVPTADGRTIPVAKVEIGDQLFLGNQTVASVVRRDVTEDVGLYNPQTTTGLIVVDNVLSTTYTTAVPVRTAHSMLAPLRAVFEAFGIDFLPRLASAAGVSHLTK